MGLSRYLVAFLVASDTAHRLDEGVTRVVHPGLDALVEGPVVGSHLVPQFGVNGRSQSGGHAVVVFPQVREVWAVRKEEEEEMNKRRKAV